MDLGLYSIYDRKGKIYNRPFIALNDDTARRMVYYMAQGDNAAFRDFPEDFALVKLGTFNDTAAIISAVEGGPERIDELKNFVKGGSTT